MCKITMRRMFIILSIVLCFGMAIRITVRSNEVPMPIINCYKNLSANSIKASETPVIYFLPGTTTEEKSVDDIWSYPISQEEIELIALVTIAEAEGETELGKRLVIDTILNRMDDSHFPDTVLDVVYYPNAFSSMWNGRVDRCYVVDEIVKLVKEELTKRTNYDCVFFTAGGYSTYGEPMFQECCHYFSSYD